MPKTLRLSTLQAEVLAVIQKVEGDISLTEIETATGFSRIEIKSICLVLIARKLIEKQSKEGRMVYSVR
jgi:DNA-binding transcriptional regulator GbsR (MarR family)